MDIRKEVDINCFETEDAANEFYLVFAWHLYIAAIGNDVSPVFEGILENDLSDLWNYVLFTFASLDADAPDWDQLPNFLKQFKGLKTRKKRERKEEAQRNIDNSLNQLKEKHEISSTYSR